MSAYDTLDARLDDAATGQRDFWITLDTIRADTDAALNSGELSDIEWSILKSRANRIHDRLWLDRQLPN